MADDKDETVKLLKEYGASLAALQGDLAAEKAKAGTDVPALKAEIEALKLKIEKIVTVPGAASDSFMSDWAGFWSGLFGE